MNRVSHLTGRFFESLRPVEPDKSDVDWVRPTLTDSEYACWASMSRADRVEAIAVARRAEAALGAGCYERWLAAALLHDVGKIDAGFGPFRRAAATVIATVAGHDRVRRWQNRIGYYIGHDDRGAARLRMVGARPEAVAWAAAHHRPRTWPATGIPPEVCAALAAADGEKSS